MALQSSVSMIEAAANPLADKFSLNKKKLVIFVAAAGAGICLVFSTGVGPVVLDVADHFLNYFNILLLGVFECALIGVNAKKINLAGEINRYSGRLRMGQRPLVFSLKYLSPAVLGSLFVWGIYHLIFIDKGVYGGYPVWAQITGWALSCSVFVCGFIAGADFKLKRAVKSPAR